MNILWLSWRDIENPKAGGAEKVAIEVTKRLARNNHQVTIFTSSFPNAKKKERFAGVNIIRQGNQLTCRLWAYLYYRKNKDFDVLVDEINTIPFFSIFYARKKVITLIHQLAREYWFFLTIWPLNILGFLAESFYLKFYDKVPTLVISNSTKNDLQKLGFRKITIARMGLDFAPANKFNKQDLILFVGRLTPIKGPQDAIIAFKSILENFPNTKLCIIGRGSPKFTSYLKRLATSLKLKNKVSFAGFVSEKQKISLMQKAKIVLIPSIREGWSLVATEANATSCVPIAYNVHGLRDSVINKKTGILIKKSPDALAKATIDLLENESKRSKIAKIGFDSAKKFSWDNTYEDFRKIIGNRSKLND